MSSSATKPWNVLRAFGPVQLSAKLQFWSNFGVFKHVLMVCVCVCPPFPLRLSEGKLRLDLVVQHRHMAKRVEDMYSIWMYVYLYLYLYLYLYVDLYLDLYLDLYMYGNMII